MDCQWSRILPHKGQWIVQRSGILPPRGQWIVQRSGDKVSCILQKEYYHKIHVKSQGNRSEVQWVPTCGHSYDHVPLQLGFETTNSDPPKETYGDYYTLAGVCHEYFGPRLIFVQTSLFALKCAFLATLYTFPQFLNGMDNMQGASWHVTFDLVSSARLGWLLIIEDWC